MRQSVSSSGGSTHCSHASMGRGHGGGWAGDRDWSVAAEIRVASSMENCQEASWLHCISAVWGNCTKPILIFLLLLFIHMWRTSMHYSSWKYFNFNHFLPVFKEYINNLTLKYISLFNIDEAIVYIHIYILYLPIKQKLDTARTTNVSIYFQTFAIIEYYQETELSFRWELKFKSSRSIFFLLRKNCGHFRQDQKAQSSQHQILWFFFSPLLQRYSVKTFWLQGKGLTTVNTFQLQRFPSWSFLDYVNFMS